MNKTEQEILQRNLAQFLVTDVFKTISEDDVLSVNSAGKWTHKGAPLTAGQLKVLKREAKQFSETQLFGLLTSELQWHAASGLHDAKTEADIISSKLLSYFVTVLFKKIRQIETL
jgi:hypothetical protein